LRIECMVLEHHGDIAFARGQQSDSVLADADVAGVDGFETCEHAQGGGLPASGGSDEVEELAIGDVGTDLVDGGGQRLRVMTERSVEGDCSHGVFNLPRMRTQPMIAGDRAVSSGLWFVSVRAHRDWWRRVYRTRIAHALETVSSTGWRRVRPATTAAFRSGSKRPVWQRRWPRTRTVRGRRWAR